MAFQGIIFDFNGVLWWDTHLQEKSWGQFSARIRGRPFSNEEMAIHVHGRNNRHTLEYLVERTLEEAKIQELTESKEQIYRRLCLDQGSAFQLSPGAVDLLEFLTAHDIARTIATASGKANLDFFVEHLHLNRWFAPWQIVYDDGSRAGKPAPDIYLQAAGNLDLNPACCVVVEDSLSGLEAARAAGIGYLIALGTAEAQPRLRRFEGVAEVVESLKQVDGKRLFLG